MLTRNLNLCYLDGDEDLGGGDLLDEMDRDDGPGPNLDDDEGGDEGGPQGEKGAKTTPKPIEDGLDDIFGTPEAAAAAAAADAEAAGGDVTKNPSVQAVLDTVRENFPKGLGPFIDDYLAPELTKMQKGFDDQMSEVAPWKTFAKNGVDPATVTEALRVAHFIATNPEQALKDVARVAQVRGLNPAEILGIQVAQAAAAGGDGKPAADDDAKLLEMLGAAGTNIDLTAEENAPLKAILKRLQAAEATAAEAATKVDQRSEAEVKQQENAAIASAMATVKKGFDARNIRINENAVMQYAVAYVNSLPPEQKNIEPLEAIKVGARNWLADVTGGAQAMQRRAPKLGGRGAAVGGAGAPKPPAKPKTIEEKMAAFIESAPTLVASDD